MRSWKLVCVVLVCAAFGAWASSRSAPRDAAREVPELGESKVAERELSTSSVPDRSRAQQEPDDDEPATAPPARFASARLEPDHREDPNTVAWDTLAPHERREILERELSSALADVRKGRAPATNVARAEATLSVLRAELMADESGAARYAKLEAEVAELSSRINPETAATAREGRP